MAVKAHCMAVARDPSTGAVLLSATINVYTPGTVTPISATIYDKNGGTLSNPLTSDASTGLIDFYLTVAQEVDLVVAKAGYTTRTYSNVPVLDDATFELSSLLTTTGDTVYASAANIPVRLPVGANGTFQTVAAGVPSWSNTISAGGLTVTAGGITVGAGSIIVPQTTGAAVFSLDANATGQSMVNTAAYSPFGASNIFGGMLLIHNVTNDEVALVVVGNATTTIVFQSGTTYSITPGAAGKLSVYLSAGQVVYQNQIGSTQEIRTMSFRTRNVA